jgi:hypothetical protein
MMCRRSIFVAARADRCLKVLVKCRLCPWVGHRNSKSKSGFGSSLEDFDLKAANYDPIRIRPAEAGRFLSIDNFHNPMGARIDQNGSIQLSS